jgi:hypothetical protein
MNDEDTTGQGWAFQLVFWAVVIVSIAVVFADVQYWRT